MAARKFADLQDRERSRITNRFIEMPRDTFDVCEQVLRGEFECVMFRANFARGFRGARQFRIRSTEPDDVVHPDDKENTP